MITAFAAAAAKSDPKRTVTTPTPAPTPGRSARPQKRRKDGTKELKADKTIREAKGITVNTPGERLQTCFSLGPRSPPGHTHPWPSRTRFPGSCASDENT